MEQNTWGYMTISSSLQQMVGGLGIIIAGSIAYQPTPDSPLQNFDWFGCVVVSPSAVAVYWVYKVSKL